MSTKPNILKVFNYYTPVYFEEVPHNYYPVSIISDGTRINLCKTDLVEVAEWLLAVANSWKAK